MSKVNAINLILNTLPTPEDPNAEKNSEEIKINSLLGEEGGPI